MKIGKYNPKINKKNLDVLGINSLPQYYSVYFELLESTVKPSISYY